MTSSNCFYRGLTTALQRSTATKVMQRLAQWRAPAPSQPPEGQGALSLNKMGAGVGVYCMLVRIRLLSLLIGPEAELNVFSPLFQPPSASVCYLQACSRDGVCF
ncbi:unnamed protein product [Arctogadus glacialis]